MVGNISCRARRAAVAERTAAIGQLTFRARGTADRKCVGAERRLNFRIREVNNFAGVFEHVDLERQAMVASRVGMPSVIYLFDALNMICTKFFQ